MNNSVTLDLTTGTAAAKEASQVSKEQEKSGYSISDLKPGQQITGMVTAVDEQVTIDFHGQQVTASREVLKNAAPGEIKTFEVVKADGAEIELRLLEGTVSERKKTIIATRISETDWVKVLSQKEQSARQLEKEKLTKEMLSKLQKISTSFTESDYQALEMEGFPVETLTVNGLYEAINRVKAETFKENPEQEASLVKITQEYIITRLKEENLPVTSKNINEVNTALALSETISRIDDKAMKYLISQEAEPTIENIYKACYSGSPKASEKKQELSEKAWKELMPQMEAVVEGAGYEINGENIEDAKWLIENRLSLTGTTLKLKKQLEEMKENTDPEVVLDQIVVGMKKGITPKEVSLETADEEVIKQLIEKVKSISPEAVQYAVKEGKELTLKRLSSVQESISLGKINISAEGLSNEKVEANVDQKESGWDTTGDEISETVDFGRKYETVKAQRQLEEIRLKMTLEAAQRLEKKGFSIETQKLEKVVEELRRLEDSYYKELLSEAEVPVSEEAVETLKATTQSLEQLRAIPCSVLGSTLASHSTQTVPSLLTEGLKLQSDYSKAGTAYETLMTVPNAEYGDSIRKAFANADSLLSTLNLEHTEPNQRAVRILGYNQMEITQENIDKVKAYDSEVASLVKNLHPAVTVRMIREGIHPLDMTIQELNTKIDQMKEEQGISSEERFSTYLHKLEKESSITPEERRAYIGVYRLLYQVEKSDGAALGSVIKADREVTLSSLLTAVQTSKKGRIEAAIDDEFGTLKELSRSKESIAGQLSSFTDADTGIAAVQKEAQESASKLAEQTRYLDRILKQVTEELSPEKLLKLEHEELQAAVSTGNASNISMSAAPVLATEELTGSQIWETLKDIPMEKLLTKLQQAEETAEAYDESYSQKVQQIRELCRNSEQSLRFLNDYQMSSTPQNIMIANHILSNGESPIVKLIKRQNENNSENTSNSIKELQDLSDNINDKSSMNEAYESLEVKAKAALETACSEEMIDSRKLAELRSTAQQMTFLRSMASKEFYQIPIETSKGITNMNLTILRGSEDTGKVSATVYSEQLGEVKADFSLKGQTLKGFISCDSRSGLERLQANTEEIGKTAEDNHILLKQLDFGLKRRESDTYSFQNPENGQQENARENQMTEDRGFLQEGTTISDQSTERILYRIAKAIVSTVRLAEDSKAEEPSAVS